MAKKKEEKAPVKHDEGTYQHETYQRIAQNTLIFLDKIKLSAVGEENKREIQAYIQAVSLIEHIIEGKIYLVEPEKVKEEYLSKQKSEE